MKTLFTKREAAEVLETSEKTIERAQKRGELEAVREKNRVFYTAQSLARYIKNRSEEVKHEQQ